MSETIEWYLKAIAYELEKLEELENYKGNLEFRFNWIEGKIASMNIGQNKTVTKPKGVSNAL